MALGDNYFHEQDRVLASMLNVMLFTDSDKSLHGIRKRR